MAEVVSKQSSNMNFRLIIALTLLANLAGCVNFNPDAQWHNPHLDRAQSQSQDGISVSAVVLEDHEAHRVYGVNLGTYGIRAIWLEIRNETDEVMHLLPTSLDLDYFSQNEAAYRFHSTFRPAQNREISEHFHGLAIRKDLRPGEISRGFVLVNRHRGGRYLIVELLGDNTLRRFDFMFVLPDGTFDFEEVQFSAIYPPEQVSQVDLAGLQQWARELPCCTTNEAGDRNGDPLNMVFVGGPTTLLGALTRSGWAFTERVAPRAIWESVQSTLLGQPEWNFPVSPLYALGRDQDLAMQRPRGSVPQRNHMRLWFTPLRFENQPVWIAQLSRDIGVKPTWHSPFLLTHVIDPEVDEDRAYLLELLLRSQSVEAYGYLEGVGEATADNPKFNLTGDPYRTDGRRLLIKFSQELVSIDRVKHLE